MTSFVGTFIWPQKLGRLFLFIDLCTAQYFVFSKLFHSFSGQGHTFQFKLFLTSFIDQPYTKMIIIKLINIGSYVNIGNVGSHYYYFRPESQTSRLQTRPVSVRPTRGCISLCRKVLACPLLARSTLRGDAFVDMGRLVTPKTQLKQKQEFLKIV